MIFLLNNESDKKNNESDKTNIKICYFFASLFM